MEDEIKIVIGSNVFYICDVCLDTLLSELYLLRSIYEHSDIRLQQAKLLSFHCQVCGFGCRRVVEFFKKGGKSYV